MSRAHGLPSSLPKSGVPPRHGAHGLVLGTAALGFVVILFGAQVANFHAGLLCLGFPLCSGSVGLPGNTLAALPWVHRALAFVFLAAAILLAVRLNRRSDSASGRAAVG